MTDNGFSDEDFLSLVKSRLPATRQATVDRLARVKDVYVECGRDRLLADQFERFFTFMLATRDGRRDDGRAFFVTGESGTGKTRAIERMLRNFEPLAPSRTSFGVVNPVVSVSLRGPCTLKMLGGRILKAAGYPFRQDIEQGKLWDMLPEQLHHRKILLVHIDETQHMIKQTEKDVERKNLGNAFKSVMNYDKWPVSFIMSGMPQTVELSRLDEQIERRGAYIEFPPISIPDELPLVVRILKKLVAAAELSPPDISGSDLPERIAHAARYQYGRVAQVIVAAIGIALDRDASELTREHFALAYLDHSHARGRDETNPFLAARWRNVDPGYFLQAAPRA